jgi:hypothetical protein
LLDLVFGGRRVLHLRYHLGQIADFSPHPVELDCGVFQLLVLADVHMTLDLFKLLDQLLAHLWSRTRVVNSI